MHNISRISLNKLSLKYPFHQSSRAISSFVLKTPTRSLNQYVSDPGLPPKSNIFCIPITKFHYFLHPIRSNPSTQFINHENLRKFSGESASDFDQNQEVDEINLKFAEAREEIDMALESKETVYFDDEAESARAAVKNVLNMFESLMAKLPESERAALQRSMGLKIEQLKAELEQLNE